MGLLDTLCDSDDHTSPSSFWRLEGVCSLTILGSAIPCVFAAGTTLALLIATMGDNRSAQPGMGKSRKLTQADQAQNESGRHSGVNGESDGREEVKGQDEDEDFIESAREPLLGQESNGREYPSARAHEANGIASADAEEGKTPKKDTGVHWVKLLLYWVQIFYHLSIGSYYVVDQHGGRPYECERPLHGFTLVVVVRGAQVLFDSYARHCGGRCAYPLCCRRGLRQCFVVLSLLLSSHLYLHLYAVRSP